MKYKVFLGRKANLMDRRMYTNIHSKNGINPQISEGLPPQLSHFR